MKPTGKLWALVAVAVAAVGALWFWFRRFGSKSPLDGATINGADVQIANVEAIQEIQVYEYTAPPGIADYNTKSGPMSSFKDGTLNLHPGDWYSLLPRPPAVITVGGTAEYGIWTNAGALMVPWTALWKARTVTVGEADAHGLIVPPDFARNYTP